MKQTLLVLLLLVGFSAVAGNPPIIINEFQADPDAINGDANGDGTLDTSEDEFLELYNDSGALLDVTGWTVSDAVGLRHTFPAGSEIAAGCSVVIFGGGTPAGVFGNSLVQTASEGFLGFNNGGDTITINDGVSEVASYVYGGEGGDNQSLTRDPDVTGTAFVKHTLATGSGGALFSPGTQIDGSQFAGCPLLADTAPEVTTTDPVDTATSVPANTTITIDFDENIDATVDAVTVVCDAQNQTFSGLPFSGSSLVITPDVPLTFEAVCAVNVVAAEISDQDGSIDNMAADYAFSFTVETEAASQIDLILNEFQADPDANNGDANGDGTSSTTEDEFIEIYNNGPNALDLSGWTMSDGNSVRHTFDVGTTLNACQSLVLFGGGVPTGSFGGALAVTASSGSIGLNNTNDTITINNGVSDVISVSYGSVGTNQSYTLDPDITGLNYVEHSTATGSAGALFSPGRQINGAPFTPCSGPTPPRVDSTVPVSGASGVALDSNIEINFSENIDATVNAATLTCGLSTIAFSGLPVSAVSQLIIDPQTDLPNGEVCSLELFAAEITDLDDSADSLDGDGDGMAGDNFVLEFIAGFPEVEIFEIQGSGFISPFLGITVITQNNIVTALDTNGFYMQTPDTRDDNELATSNGMFVFTVVAPEVQVGDLVDVTGEVFEFFNSTQITNSIEQVITVTSSGNPLPTPLILDDTFPSTDPTVFDCGLEALERECFEGMYFEMPQGFVSAASVGTFFAGTNEDDVYVKAGSARAFREPGIEFPGLPGLPVFDGNPELIEMSIEALGLPFQALSAGTEFSAKGVIGYAFEDYELQPSEFILINENVIPRPVRDATIDEFTLASANIQRFFNDIDDIGPEDDDQVADPAVYANRLVKLADYVINDMKSPTIIGLQEIENLSVLNDLIAAIASAGGPSYSAELIDGNDQGGIDVAYLYQSNLLSNVVFTQLGLNELNTFDGSLLHDRPPLRLAADVAVGNATFPVNVLVVHMRSRGGIDDNTDGERVRSKRLQQANSVAAMVNDILTSAPNTSLFVVGDFNAFQFTDGYVDVVGQITGSADQAVNLVWSEPLLVNTPLTQAVQTLAADQQYSFVFRGTAQILDNALMNDAGLMSFNEIQFVRGQADAYIKFEDDSSSLRSTDHDGFVLFIKGNDDLIFKNGFE